MELNWVDYAVIGIILLYTLISLVRGFIAEAVSLASWVLAIWVVFFYGDGALTQSLAEQLAGITERQWLRLLVAGSVIFMAILIVGALVNYIIGRFAANTGFSGTDRTLGAVFGVLKGVLVVGLVIMLAGLTTLPQDPWWKQSYLLPLFQEKVVTYKAYLPEQIAKNFDFSRDAEPASAVLPLTPDTLDSAPATEPDVPMLPATNR